MKRTGSMRSRVGPAVTTTLRPRSKAAVCRRVAPRTRRRRCPAARPCGRRRFHRRPGCLRPDRAIVTPRWRSTATLACVAALAHIRRFMAGATIERRIGGEAQRRQQVVRQAVRESREEIGRGWRDHDALRPAREFDVPHGGFGRGVPQVRAHGPPRQRLERERRDELLRAGGHHDLHLRATILQSAREFGALVGGDAARHAEQDAHV